MRTRDPVVLFQKPGLPGEGELPYVITEEALYACRCEFSPALLQRASRALRNTRVRQLQGLKMSLLFKTMDALLEVPVSCPMVPGVGARRFEQQIQGLRATGIHGPWGERPLIRIR